MGVVVHDNPMRGQRLGVTPELNLGYRMPNSQALKRQTFLKQRNALSTGMRESYQWLRKLSFF
jgi:hypothetical protein